MDKRETIYCDCHGTVSMGYRVGDKVVWFDNRHGEKHQVSIVVANMNVTLDRGHRGMPN